MPLVNVHMVRGRTTEQKEALMRAITEAVVRELGADRAAVRVWIQEFDRDDFMAGGETLAQRRDRLAGEADT